MESPQGDAGTPKDPVLREAEELASSVESLSVRGDEAGNSNVQVHEGHADSLLKTPEYSLPGKVDGDDVKKQLFSLGSPLPTASTQDDEPIIEEPSDKPGQDGQPSPRLNLTIDPPRSGATSATLDPAAMAAIGMSPGARTFAPPFGARFGDRSCAPRLEAGAKGMEKVQEEEGDGELSGEPSPDASGSSSQAGTSSSGLHSELSSAVQPVTAPAAVGAPSDSGSLYQAAVPPSSALQHPSAHSLGAAVDETSQLHMGHHVGSPDAGTWAPDSRHAPRVASSTFNASAASDAASRPRLRMAFEGNRDDNLVPSESSKFAPTPRVKPKDGLPWAK